MSRIIRSLDRRGAGASRLDLSRRQVGPARPDRPAGGFSGQRARDTTDPRIPMAQAMLEDARRAVEDARRQAEEIQREAWHAGFEQGEKAGSRMALQKNQPLVEQLGELIGAIQGERENLVRSHEAELVKIAFMIAMRVVRERIEMDPEIVRRNVEAALAKVTHDRQVRLRLAPADLSFVQRVLAEAPPKGWAASGISLEADDSITRGGCRIEGDTGMIDATIETQLRSLKEMLWEE